MPDIDTLQHTIIQEFSTLGKDPEIILEYLMELGIAMPPLDTKYKIPEYLVPGCLSNIWLVQKKQDNTIQILADSNAAITKGLVSLLIRIFSHQPIQDIAHTKLFFLHHLPLHHLIGVQRRNGFEQIFKKIRAYARHLLIR